MYRLFSCLLVIFLIPLAVPIASACGEKYIPLIRDCWMPASLADARPGRLLLYRNQASEAARSLLDSEMEEVLERAGHAVDVAKNEADLLQAINSKDYDVVLAAADDAGQVRTLSDSTVLPVIHRASLFEVTELEKQYCCVLNTPTRRTQLHAVLEEAIAHSR